ncbi:MAG: hypothetical protein IKG42_06435 [Clostridia bacterium]|nr:hypothetical protein [Clostridia bacterium]
METQNITNTISNSLNSLFSSLQKSLDDDIFKALDKLTFIDSDILNSKYFSNLLTDKANGLIVLANALLFGVLLYYACSYLFSRFSLTKHSQSPLQFLSKFVVCAILINFSGFICEQILYVFDIITDCVRQIGFFFFSINVSFEFWSKELHDVFLAETVNPMINIFTFDGILQSFIYVGLINLLFTYSLRYIFISILILFFPFAILSLILDSTNWIFKMWMKNFFSLLFVQIFISVVLLLIISIKYSFTDYTVKILYIGRSFCPNEG